MTALAGMMVSDSAPDLTQKEKIWVVGAAIFDAKGRCLIAQRSAKMSNPLLWEFPGGKVEDGESPERALARELEEELGVEVEVGAFVARGSAVIPGTSAREIILDVYRATLVDGTRQAIPREHAELAWVAPEDFGRYSFAEADMPAVDALAAASK